MTIFENEISGCLERIKELESEADELRVKHWSFHLRENVLLAPREKGRLNIRVRRRGSVLEIYWTHFRFIKKEGSGKTNIATTYISKGTGSRYKDVQLAKYAKKWELEVVLEYEKEFAKIRAEYADIAKALAALRRAQKKAVARSASIEKVAN